MTALQLTVTAAPPAILAVHSTSPPKDVSSIWMWVASVAMVAVMSMIAFKNAKRSHQD